MPANISHKTCETCGSSLDLEAPSGFCPACLFQTALNPEGEEAESAGARFTDFEILEEVARGGMGIVYRARQHLPPRVVALKMILPGHVNSTGAIARFRAEAEAAAALDHEGILPIYAVGEKDGAPFYSMKFADGGSLSARIAEFQGQPQKAAKLVAAIARAVEHAHKHGILHRDLKPGNVLFDGADKPFVSDFGLAKWLEREADLTQTLAVLGTPYYMAPEQAAGEHALTSGPDIYSLGAILFHLLTGQPPFHGDNADGSAARCRGTIYAAPARTQSSCSGAILETICLKCLEKNPSARYHSAAALADDLDRFLARRAILARRANPITHAWRWARRNPSIAGLGAAAVALARFAAFRSATGNTAENAGLGKINRRSAFRKLSGNKDDALLLRGIQDDLLVSLSKIGDLKVISRQSVIRYQDPARDLPAIGKALGVNAVLEGSFRRRADQYQVNVQLVNAAKGEQIWAENYERARADISGLQRDLATRVAFALKAKLTQTEGILLQRRPTENNEAYLLYLQARDIVYANRRELGDLKRAEELLEKATVLDPRSRSLLRSYPKWKRFWTARLTPRLGEGRRPGRPQTKPFGCNPIYRKRTSRSPAITARTKMRAQTPTMAKPCKNWPSRNEVCRVTRKFILKSVASSFTWENGPNRPSISRKRPRSIPITKSVGTGSGPST